ncbi:hypothetical protein [Acidovorax sp. 106]|uniref:hypothetical protein n=1 Tax=Acidovorax sp. 106 TaxID=2135637 RepID=UPI000EB501EB|nr:hypothetical protein [Acidovorax sp. 106]RLJ36670.1 hypothetical protein C8C98_0356 [Acidovorax sp. 106]
MRTTKIHQFLAGSEISNVSYDLQNLRIHVGHSVVLFTDAVGFRVLDEGDLLEFWPACSTAPGGVIFEIHDGGWLEQESRRKGFMSSSTRPALREFLVTGLDDCVGVFAFSAPELTVGLE